jgi:hypothetical protein
MTASVSLISRALLTAALVGACSSADRLVGDDTTTIAPTAGLGPTTTAEAPIEVAVKLGTTKVVGAGAPHADPPPINTKTSTEIIDAVAGYVRAAFIAPLEGRPANLKGLLAMGATARLAKGEHDRAVLTTEGITSVQRAQTRLKPVDLVGLTEGFGTMPLVSARIEFTAELLTDDGPLTVTHLGELVLAEDEGWKVVGYEMIVIRDDGTGNASTTTATVRP